MGMKKGFICKSCEKKFNFRVGGGRYFHLLHCDTCGKEKTISFFELQKRGHSITEELFWDKNYQQELEANILSCECGGLFKFYAVTRCPNCKGTDIEDDPNACFVMYD